MHCCSMVPQIHAEARQFLSMMRSPCSMPLCRCLGCPACRPALAPLPRPGTGGWWLLPAWRPRVSCPAQQAKSLHCNCNDLGGLRACLVATVPMARLMPDAVCPGR